MTKKRLKNWTLACSALFFAMSEVMGCSTAPKEPPVATTAAVNPLDEQPDAAPAPQVNVFGELNGVATGPGKLVGDEGYQQHTFADEGYDADVSVDPTGKWLCFASTRHSEHPTIYLQRVDGTTVTRLTSDESDNAFPTFSPDGKRIAFCSTRSGVWNLYSMDIEGKDVVQLTAGNNQCVHPSFSPDGGRLVYSCLGTRSNQWELWTIDLSTNERREIGYGLFPNWCPAKGKDKIAFQRARQRGSRWFSLWTLELENGEARRVSEVAVSSNAAVVSASWSPDGKRLAFATIVDPSKKAPRKRGEQDVWTINSDGTDRRRLTDGNGVNISPVWAFDNRVYFISDRGGSESVWSVRPAADTTFTAKANTTDNKKETVGSADTAEVEK